MSSKANKRRDREHQRAWTRRSVVRGVAGVGAAAVLGVGGYAWFSGGRGRSFSVQGGETRPVLDPSRFDSAYVQQSYALARRYADVLDQLFCYCHCDGPPFNHVSLLSCFATPHGAG